MYNSGTEPSGDGGMWRHAEQVRPGPRRHHSFVQVNQVACVCICIVLLVFVSVVLGSSYLSQCAVMQVRSLANVVSWRCLFWKIMFHVQQQR
jgi:hypothetical protein